MSLLTHQKSFFAILPAAGLGVRFGGKKQFLKIKDRSLLEWTLDVFTQSKIFKKIVVCVPAEDLELASKNFARENVIWVEGGSNRAESVYKGFCALNAAPNDGILIHDAARPCVSVDLIQRVAYEVSTKHAVIPTVMLADTIKEVRDHTVIKTLDRNQLVAVQTPQGFSSELLRRVYKTLEFNSPHPPLSIRGGDRGRYTDEAMMVEALGEPVYTVEGERFNLKVTSPDDLKIAEFYLKSTT